ncbi:MAG TPA: hypothetical protein VEK39_00305 [Solirubrobacterales bacterium]|nr:hypothetical protein [Solirubrobacterales bacterium]
MSGAAFYCVADQRYFLGAVGLVNSLRLVGHDEPIFLLDCGLTVEQRELLAPHLTLVDAPADAPPTLLKTIAPLRHPAETVALIDTDLIVTRRLTELLERASEGRVVAFRNDMDRFVAEWGAVLDLGSVRRQPYVAFAFVCMDRSLASVVLGLIEDRQGRIDFDRSTWGRHDPDYPLLYADQDVLNAILASRVEADRVVALDDRLAPVPPFRGLRVVDEGSLRCAYEDGTEPYVVHHFVVKPWLEPTHHGVYSRLLRRLLIGDDVTIRVPPDRIPLRLRRGARAFVERKRVNARERFRLHVREPLSSSFGGPGARRGGSEK